MTNRQWEVYNPGTRLLLYSQKTRRAEEGFWHSNHIEPWPHRNHSMTLKETVLYRSSLPNFLSSCYHCSWNQRALEEEVVVVVVGGEGRLASSRHWAETHPSAQHDWWPNYQGPVYCAAVIYNTAELEVQQWMLLTVALNFASTACFPLCLRNNKYLT